MRRFSPLSWFCGFPRYKKNPEENEKLGLENVVEIYWRIKIFFPRFFSVRNNLSLVAVLTFLEIGISPFFSRHKKIKIFRDIRQESSSWLLIAEHKKNPQAFFLLRHFSRLNIFRASDFAVCAKSFAASRYRIFSPFFCHARALLSQISAAWQ